MVITDLREHGLCLNPNPSRSGAFPINGIQQTLGKHLQNLPANSLGNSQTICRPTLNL